MSDLEVDVGVDVGVRNNGLTFIFILDFDSSIACTTSDPSVPSLILTVLPGE